MNTYWFFSQKQNLDAIKLLKKVILVKEVLGDDLFYSLCSH